MHKVHGANMPIEMFTSANSPTAIFIRVKMKVLDLIFLGHLGIVY